MYLFPLPRVFRAAKPAVGQPHLGWREKPISRAVLRGRVVMNALPASSADDFELFAIMVAAYRVAGIRAVPVVDPFPHVPDHVIDAVGTLASFITAHRRQRRAVSPHSRVGQGHVERLAPRKLAAVRASGGLFPFRLGRKSFALPLAEGKGLMPS